MDTHDAAGALTARIKDLMVQELMLQVSSDEIGDETPLFGPGSLGLDSVDALQLVVMLEKHFGLKISDPAAAKETLQTVGSIARAVAKKQAQA